MEKIYEIASNVSTPLALSGLIVAVLFYIFQRILSSKFIPQVKKDQGFEIIKKIVHVIFILAVISILLGFISYLTPKVMAYYYPGLKKDYIDVGTDKELSLEDIANIVGQQQNTTVVFNSNCDSSIRQAMIEPGDHNGNGMTEFLENLKQRVKGKDIYYNVKEMGEHRYEINCN